MTFSLSPGQAQDAPEGRELLKRPSHLLMDRAYEGDATRQLALDLGFIAVVPPLDVMFIAFICFALIADGLR